MWLEAMYASMSIAGLCGVTLGVNALFPKEVKRLGRIMRAQLGSRFKVKPKRPTIEIALHAEVEVDMKWWDEEFAKLKREIPTDGWSKWMDSQLVVMDEINKVSAEKARLDAERSFRAGIVGLTDGNVTYHYAPQKSQGGYIPPKTHARPKVEECEFCEYKEIHTYSDPYVRRLKTTKCWECDDSEKKRMKAEAIRVRTQMQMYGIS